MSTPQNDENASGNSSVDSANQDDTKDSSGDEWRRRILAEKKREQAKNKELAEKLAIFEAEKAEREQRELEAKGKYDEAQKKLKEELARKDQELSEFKTLETSRRKYGAVLKQLGAGFDSKYAKIVDFEEVAISDDGDIDEMSAKKVADKVRAEWPEAFKKSGPRTDDKAPAGSANGGRIAESEWKKLSSKDMKKYKNSQIDWGS